jgi:hypothetical protein
MQVEVKNSHVSRSRRVAERLDLEGSQTPPRRLDSERPRQASGEATSGRPLLTAVRTNRRSKENRGATQRCVAGGSRERLDA